MSIAESKKETLEGACPEMVAATVAEIIWTIQERMDYSKLTTSEQVGNFNRLVEVAAGLICEACPEFVRPVQMNITTVREIDENSVKKYQTVH